jgi:hypothetical protein
MKTQNKNSQQLMNIVLALILAVSIGTFHRRFSQQNNSNSDTTMLKSISQNVSCKCGKVQLAIESPSALRVVCYSKDYRGYYNTLNELAEKNNHKPAAELDAWGGVDLTQIYPSEVKITKGQELAQPSLIREKSPIRRVYASCCETPLFDIGGSGAAMLHTNLFRDDKIKPDVKFRIIGRDALPGKKEEKRTKPSMSWSVPLNWFWVMPGRIKKAKAEPLPLDISKPVVLENFKQGCEKRGVASLCNLAIHIAYLDGCAAVMACSVLYDSFLLLSLICKRI